MNSLTTDQILPGMTEHVSAPRAKGILAEMVEDGVLARETDADGVTHWRLSDEWSDLRTMFMGEPSREPEGETCACGCGLETSGKINARTGEPPRFVVGHNGRYS